MTRDEELVAKRHVRHHLAAAEAAEASTPGEEGRRSRPRIVAYSDSSGDEGGVRRSFFVFQRRGWGGKPGPSAWWAGRRGPGRGRPGILRARARGQLGCSKGRAAPARSPPPRPSPASIRQNSAPPGAGPPARPPATPRPASLAALWAWAPLGGGPGSAKGSREGTPVGEQAAGGAPASTSDTAPPPVPLAAVGGRGRGRDDDEDEDEDEDEDGEDAPSTSRPRHRSFMPAPLRLASEAARAGRAGPMAASATGAALDASAGASAKPSLALLALAASLAPSRRAGRRLMGGGRVGADP